MLHLWGKYIRACRKRNARSSRSRSATARASGRWPVCWDAARPASAGRLNATRGSVQRERVLPAVPAETAEDGPVDGRILHRRPRAAQGRSQARRTAQALPPVMRTPVGAGGRMAGLRLVAAAHQRQAARPVPRRLRHARAPGDRLPLDPRRPPSP